MHIYMKFMFHMLPQNHYRLILVALQYYCYLGSQVYYSNISIVQKELRIVQKKLLTLPNRVHKFNNCIGKLNNNKI